MQCQTLISGKTWTNYIRTGNCIMTSLKKGVNTYFSTLKIQVMLIWSSKQSWTSIWSLIIEKRHQFGSLKKIVINLTSQTNVPLKFSWYKTKGKFWCHFLNWRSKLKLTFSRP